MSDKNDEEERKNLMRESQTSTSSDEDEKDDHVEDDEESEEKSTFEEKKIVQTLGPFEVKTIEQSDEPGRRRSGERKAVRQESHSGDVMSVK